MIFQPQADLILQNDSILKDKVGTQIASDIVNIFDDASLKEGFGYYPYDVEGVKTKPNQLVKDGKLVSLLNSRETASKLNMKSSLYNIYGFFSRGRVKNLREKSQKTQKVFLYLN